MSEARCEFGRGGKLKVSASKIKALRSLKGFSQEALSIAMQEAKYQVSIATLKRIETGKEISYRVGSELARFFGVKIEDLLVEELSEGDEPPSPKIDLFVFLITQPKDGSQCKTTLDLYLNALLHCPELCIYDRAGPYLIAYDVRIDGGSIALSWLSSFYQDHMNAQRPLQLKIACQESKWLKDGKTIDSRDLDRLVTLVQMSADNEFCLDSETLKRNDLCQGIERIDCQGHQFWRFTSPHKLREYSVGYQREQALTLVEKAKDCRSEKQLICIQITGASGVGKSHWCKWLAHFLIEQKCSKSLIVEGKKDTCLLSTLVRKAIGVDRFASEQLIKRTLTNSPFSPNEIHQVMEKLVKIADCNFGREEAILLSELLNFSQIDLLVVDDIHFVDEMYCSFLMQAMAFCKKQPILVMSSLSPFQARLPVDWRYVAFNLSPLEMQDSHQLATHWVGERVAVDQAAEVCCGNPKFLLQLLLEENNNSIPDSRTYSFIEQQMKLLTKIQLNVLWGVVACGSRAEKSLIENAFPGSENVLQILCHYSLLREVDEECYGFFHPSILVYLKHRIPKEKWVSVNGQLSKTLLCKLDQDANQLEEILKLASFQTQCEDYSKAFEHFIQGARILKDSGCLVQAIEVMESAKWVLSKSPSLAREIDFLLLQGALYKSHYGWSSPQQKLVFRKIKQLCSGDTQPSLLASVLFNQWLQRLMALDLEEALTVAEELLSYSRSVGDQCIEVHGLAALTNTYYWLGKTDDVLDAAESALRLHNDQDQLRDLTEFGQDPRVVCFLFLVLTHSIVGDTQSADLHLEQLNRLASSSDDQFTRAIAGQASLFYYYHREMPLEVEQHSRSLLKLAETHSLPFFIGIAKLFMGWAVGRQGEPEPGLMLVREGYHHWLAKSGHVMGHSIYSCMVCELLILNNQPKEALEILDVSERFMQYKNELCHIDKLMSLRHNISLSN